MNKDETRKHLIYIYERLRDQHEFIADLTTLMAPLLKSVSESCPDFSEVYGRNSRRMQPKVIRAKLESLEELEARIEGLKAGTD